MPAVFAMLGVRFVRMVPLILVLLVVAAIIYLVVKFLTTPVRAKEILSKVFTIVGLVISIFFLLFTLYALFEHNTPVFELALSGLIIGLIVIAIARICHAVLIRHNPHYKDHPEKARRIFTKQEIFQRIMELLLARGQRR